MTKRKGDPGVLVFTVFFALIGVAVLGGAWWMETDAQRLSVRADRSYDAAASAAAAAGVHLPPRDFRERYRSAPPSATAPWTVTFSRDEMRGLDLVKACAPSTNDFPAILCIDRRAGDDAPVVTVETSDALDCRYSECAVSVRIGDRAVQELGVEGTLARFRLIARRGVDIAGAIENADVVWIEAAFERNPAERRQMRFDTRNLSRALAWRPPAENDVQR